MSSESDRSLDASIHSPRKRRRLGSVPASRLRKHDILRKHDVEARYNNEYRVLFNEQLTQIASRFETNESVQHYNKQIGASVWSAKEQALFFGALERLGRDNIPGISAAVGTKTDSETREFLLLLQDAAARHGNAKVTLRDVPAAIEIGDECNQQLDEAGEALAWFQERFEAAQEQERYGAYWLITPTISQDIEDATESHARARTASTPQDRAPISHGRTVAGACTSCKVRKKKCNRETPCSNCVRSEIQCLYPEKSLRLQKSATTAQSIEESRDEASMDTQAASAERAPILDAVPEADLLKPRAMLILSKHLFMNRSNDIPSPWLHWSEYTSELAAEPSMYRTAFNDFHRLVVSITRRLVQSAVIQASSRLRVQRLRKDKKVLQPFVKTRDVHTAIDVLGMKRNGNERWRGVPRRCGLKVIARTNTPEGKYKRGVRVVPWDECESIMGPAIVLNGRSSTEAETSAESGNFKARAIRSGTPLPMQSLRLSDSEAELRSTDLGDNTEGEDSETSDSEELLQSARPIFPPRDVSGRYTSMPPTSAAHEPPHQHRTLEEFDQEASRQDERVLWNLLGLQPTITERKSPIIGQDSQEPELGINEKITTMSDDWRKYTQYRAPWEVLGKSGSNSRLFANQKPQKKMQAAFVRRSYSTGSLSDSISDVLSVGAFEQPAQKRPTEVELRARSTNAYAALQSHDLDDSGPDYSSSISGSSDEDIEKDIPTQSIEADYDNHYL